MDLQQVKKDLDSNVLISDSTWKKVLDTALEQEAEAVRLTAERAARDMAVAEAVHHAAFAAVREGSYEFWPVRLNKLNLAAIIAKATKGAK